MSLSSPREELVGHSVRAIGLEVLNVTRQELAHRRAARAIDAYRAYEAQADGIFRELTVALEEQLKVNHVEVKPEKNKWMTEAYREWQVQEQVKKERRG
jgi:hypothetical protein